MLLLAIEEVTIRIDSVNLIKPELTNGIEDKVLSGGVNLRTDVNEAAL